MATTMHARQLGLDGSIRSTSTNAFITSTSTEFLKQLDTTTLPATVTLTANNSITTGISYQWSWANSIAPTTWNSIPNQTTSILVVTSANFVTWLSTGTSVTFKVTATSTDYVESSATYTITNRLESSDVVQAVLGSPNVSISTDSAGTSPILTNSGTTITVTTNGKALTYAATGADTFSVGVPTQSVASAVTLATPSSSATILTYGNITGITSDYVEITYPVTVRNSQNTAKPVINLVQKYFKIKPGQSTLSAILTNDTHVIPTDAAGLNGLYTGSGTQIYVYDGNTQLDYDGVGTLNGKWTVSAAGTNITPGSITDGGTYAQVAQASAINLDTANILYTISGKTANGISFSFTKTQSFSRAKSGTNPIVYQIVSTSPVITKQSSNAATAGVHSSVILQGKKYEGSTTTNYGWITVTANGDTEQFPAIDTNTDTYTLSPLNTAGKTTYTIRLYNQPASGGVLLDTEIIDVVFKGETGNSAPIFSIDNAATTFIKDTTGTISPASVVLTTTAVNFTGITYQWQKNGVNISGATSSSYTVPAADYSSVLSNNYKCAATGTINGVTGQVLNDTITIPRLDYGTSSPTVVLSNENVTFGGPLSGYTGITFTGGSCDITAYIGTTQLSYATTGANTFSVSQSTTGATVAAGTAGANTYSVPEPSAMSADTAYTDVTVVMRDASGTALPGITKRISYSLSRTGATGISPVFIDLSNDNVSIATAANGSGGVYTSANTNVTLTSGTTNVISNATISITPSTGVTYTHTRNGTAVTGVTEVANLAAGTTSLNVNITALSQDSGTLTIAATYNSVEYTAVFTVSKAKAGTDGSPATVYEVEANGAFNINVNTNAITPASITYSAFFVTGTAARSAYGTGSIVTQRSSNGTDWVDIGVANQSTASIASSALAATDRFVRATLYTQPTGGGTLVDQETTPLSVSGTNGLPGVGSPGPSVKTATTYIYWRTAQAAATSIPNPTFTLSATSPYNFTTGSLAIATNGGTNEWSQTPPTFEAGTSSNNYWYKLITISQTNTDAQVVTQGTTLLGTSFTNLVTFTSLSETGTTAIDGGRITTGTLSADRIAAGAITTNKLLITPVSICPDPYFADTAWWRGSGTDIPGWYFEAASVGTPNSAVLWSGATGGAAPGTGRKHLWSNSVISPVAGTVLRLKAVTLNTANQVVYCAARFYSGNNTDLADATLIVPAGSALQTRTVQITVPNNAAYIKFILYNEANNTFSGAAYISGVMLDVAATGDLVVDGAITANKIDITAGSTAGRVVIDSNKILVYGDNGSTVRVKIGNLN
jgi:hypothetical protein